ncbi:hypothetical protein ACIBG8_54285 [Nonomuraea sp. NPDC050556]|uniref:hypothetical protein n=1 Tax=Nonomuraea sp. NPDC050556 TaxID=3364369 RepID=UPI00378C7DA5
MTMSYTPLFKLPYPDSAEDSQTWKYWQQLAQAIEQAWTPQLISAPVASWSTGWGANADNPCYAYTCGPWAFISLYATRTGADITAAASGSIADSPMCTLIASLFPKKIITVPMRTSYVHGSAYVDVNGTASLASLAGTAVLATGQNVMINTMWPLIGMIPAT